MPIKEKIEKNKEIQWDQKMALWHIDSIGKVMGEMYVSLWEWIEVPSVNLSFPITQAALSLISLINSN